MEHNINISKIRAKTSLKSICRTIRREMMLLIHSFDAHQDKQRFLGEIEDVLDLARKSLAENKPLQKIRQKKIDL